MPMPDPFEALRTAPTPIDPDPAFAARLRARVVRALLTSQGDLNVTLQATDTAPGRHQFSVVVGCRCAARIDVLQLRAGLDLYG
jgi:hypothetical protein